MANVRVQNRTTFLLAVPRPLNLRLKQGQVKEVEVIDVDRTFNDPRIKELVDKKWLKLTMVQDDTPDSGATLPFYTSAQLPAALGSSGMMVYNTSIKSVLYSDGTAWFAPMTIPVFSGSLPVATDYPEPFLIYEKDSQSIYVNQGSSWNLTKASGVETRPSHQFPPPSGLPAGGLLFDTDNDQLKINDGNGNWRLINSVQDYSTVANLPPVTSVGFGALVYTSTNSTLWTRVGSSYRPTTGVLRFYATFGDLPTLGNDDRGTIAYIDDDRAVLVWDGKYWRYLNQLPTYKTSDVPDPANYVNGHLIVNGDNTQPLICWAGQWEGITPSAKSYAAAGRPSNANLPEGTVIWNATSNKANFNIGGSWVDALGVVDP